MAVNKVFADEGVSVLEDGRLVATILPAEAFAPMAYVAADIVAERVRHSQRWSPGHDDAHLVYDWAGILDEWVTKLRRTGTEPSVRKLYVQIASIAAAAIESGDRQRQTESW